MRPCSAEAPRRQQQGRGHRRLRRGPAPPTTRQRTSPKGHPGGSLRSPVSSRSGSSNPRRCHHCRARRNQGRSSLSRLPQEPRSAARPQERTAPGAGALGGVLDHGAQELPDMRHIAGKGGGSGACGTAGHGILHQGWRALPEATKRCIPALHLQGARKGTAGRYTWRRLWTSFIITDPRRQGVLQWVLLAHRTQ